MKKKIKILDVKCVKKNKKKIKSTKKLPQDSSIAIRILTPSQIFNLLVILLNVYQILSEYLLSKLM